MQSLMEKYNCGIYCRFSKDDPHSESVGNQLALLREYVGTQYDWNIVGEYIDDGITGALFDRPGFKRLERDINAGLINLVITKDLSRLGRNYIRSGDFIEYFFPTKGVRFIALGDNVDTVLNKDNDMVPVKNLFNEFYCKDISKKTRAIKTMKAREGKFMGSQAPYGYIRDVGNKHKLIPNIDTAKNISYIFDQYARGVTARYIAEKLNEQNILPPHAYFLSTQNRLSELPDKSLYWGAASVSQILKNRVYIGHMVQCKRRNVSYKMKIREIVPENEWVIVENTHEPLVDMKVWNKVQQRFADNTRARSNCVTSTPKVCLFSSFVWCGDCGARLAANHKRDKVIYRCSTYANKGKLACSIHSISEDVLEAFVLQRIRHLGMLAKNDSKLLFSKIKAHCMNTIFVNNRDNLAKELDDINAKIHRVFDEKCNGTIDDIIYATLMRDFSASKKNIEAQLADTNNAVSEINYSMISLKNWIDNMAQLANASSLNREILSAAIERIVVSDNTDSSSKFDIKISFPIFGNDTFLYEP